jgi:hypothetical protein
MTDIVERLHRFRHHGMCSDYKLIADAAAEIERLEAENESLRRALDIVPGKPTEQDIEWAAAPWSPSHDPSADQTS